MMDLKEIVMQVNWIYEVDGQPHQAMSAINNINSYHHLTDENDSVGDVIPECVVLINNNVAAMGMTEGEALENYSCGNVEKNEDDTSVLYFG